MSDRSLTGYDNRDAVSGEPDEEVYLYDAVANRLVCASCNPTGARPEGIYDSGEAPDPLVDQSQIWRERWLAASVPGWTRGINASNGNPPLYQPRYLSDSGRLFFDSSDALVPQAIDGLENVYEYEPVGVGSCSGSSVTFGGASDGCVGLISSGSSSEESVFVDASESGDDVFFLTAGRLVAQDQDEALDVYDAHVCGGEGVACPSVVASPPACTTADSCRAAVSPQPSVFGAPASATFSGVGNAILAPAVVVKPKSKRAKCGGGLVKQNGRCVKARAKKGKTKAKKPAKGRK